MFRKSTIAEMSYRPQILYWILCGQWRIKFVLHAIHYNLLPRSLCIEIYLARDPNAYLIKVDTRCKRPAECIYCYRDGIPFN